MASTILSSDQTLYHFVPGRKLGSGGWGEVFQARVLETRQQVALKRFRTDVRSSRAAERDWAAEWVKHEAVAHSNILQVYDAFFDDGSFYIVTELASFTLEHNVEDGLCWEERDVIRAGMQISSALHYLHEHWQPGEPLVHRDITTKNIFYFQDPDVFKVGDFGISKLLSAPDQRATSQVANWGFVAPELVRDGYTTPQSDLFQLGLVLYAMLAGEHAIDQTLPKRERVNAIKDGVAHEQASALPIDSDGLRRTIRKLLIRRLDRRYQTASEVFAELWNAEASDRKLRMAKNRK